jgi:hypothetical protein
MPAANLSMDDDQQRGLMDILHNSSSSANWTSHMSALPGSYMPAILAICPFELPSVHCPPAVVPARTPGLIRVVFLKDFADLKADDMHLQLQ